MTLDMEARAVSPKAPEVRNPVTTRPRTMAAGTRTGLKRMNSGAATASPIRVPMNVIPAIARRVPPVH